MSSDTESSSSSGSVSGQDAGLMKLYTSMMLDLIEIPKRETPIEVPMEVDTATQKEVMNSKKRKMEKKKLKREESKRVKDDVVEEVDFKMFSHQPIKLISLLPPAEDFLAIPNPRHRKYSEEELATKRERIRSSAIEGQYVRSAATTSNAIPAEKLDHMRTESFLWSSELPNIAIAERPKMLSSPMVQTPTNSTKKSSKKKRAEYSSIPLLTSPWPSDTTCLPPPLPPTRAEQRRQSHHLRKIAKRDARLGLRSTELSLSGKTKKIVKKREAKFWAPETGIGGKSRGYAYGFVGSREGARGKDPWVRDKMRNPQ